MVRKLTNDYKEKLDNLSDREVVARFDLVIDNFVSLYKIYLVNSINFGVDKSLNAWSTLRNYRKLEFGYTNFVEEKELRDISLNPNQLNNKDSQVLSNLIYQSVINNGLKINENSLEISKEIIRYYKPFVFDYIKESRPHLIQETNNILINKYKVTGNSKVNNDNKSGVNNKPKAV